MKRTTVLLVLVLCACATYDDPVDPEPYETPQEVSGYYDVTIGMTYSQVTALMGYRDDTSTYTVADTVYKTCYWYQWGEYTCDWIYYFAIDFEDNVVVGKFSY